MEEPQHEPETAERPPVEPESARTATTEFRLPQHIGLKVTSHTKPDIPRRNRSQEPEDVEEWSGEASEPAEEPEAGAEPAPSDQTRTDDQAGTDEPDQAEEPEPASPAEAGTAEDEPEEPEPAQAEATQAEPAEAEVAQSEPAGEADSETESAAGASEDTSPQEPEPEPASQPTAPQADEAAPPPAAAEGDSPAGADTPDSARTRPVERPDAESPASRPAEPQEEAAEEPAAAEADAGEAESAPPDTEETEETEPGEHERAEPTERAEQPEEPRHGQDADTRGTAPTVEQPLPPRPEQPPAAPQPPPPPPSPPQRGARYAVGQSALDPTWTDQPTTRPAPPQAPQTPPNQGAQSQQADAPPQQPTRPRHAQPQTPEQDAPQQPPEQRPTRQSGQYSTRQPAFDQTRIDHQPGGRHVSPPAPPEGSWARGPAPAPPRHSQPRPPAPTPAPGQGWESAPPQDAPVQPRHARPQAPPEQGPEHRSPVAFDQAAGHPAAPPAEPGQMWTVPAPQEAERPAPRSSGQWGVPWESQQAQQQYVAQQQAAAQQPVLPQPAPRQAAQERPRRARRRLLITVVAVLVLVAGVVAGQLVRPVPDPTMDLSIAATHTFPGTAPAMPWPVQGQSVVYVDGLGTMGSSGPSAPTPTASVAKVMTAYVYLRDHPLQSGLPGPVLTVSPQAAAQIPARKKRGESLLGVTANQRLTQRKALEALMLISANDVAHELARWDAGSDPAFVAKMNATARSLGMTSTTYTDPSGYDSGTVSTAADQVKLLRAAMSIPAFAEIVNNRAYVPDGGGEPRPGGNILIGQLGVVGGKTGYTDAAGGNFVFAARKRVAGVATLIVGAVMAQRSTSAMAAVTAGQHLVAAAENALTAATVAPAGATVGWVDDGLGGRTPLRASAPVTVVGWPGLTVPVGVAGDAPHHGGQSEQVGAVTAGPARVPLVLNRTLDEPSLFKRLIRLN